MEQSWNQRVDFNGRTSVVGWSKKIQIWMTNTTNKTLTHNSRFSLCARLASRYDKSEHFFSSLLNLLGLKCSTQSFCLWLSASPFCHPFLSLSFALVLLLLLLLPETTSCELLCVHMTPFWCSFYWNSYVQQNVCAPWLHKNMHIDTHRCRDTQ